MLERLSSGEVTPVGLVHLSVDREKAESYSKIFF